MEYYAAIQNDINKDFKIKLCSRDRSSFTDVEYMQLNRDLCL